MKVSLKWKASVCLCCDDSVVNSDLILLSALYPVNVIALRLYPSVPGNMKVAVQDDVWPGTQPHFQLQKLKHVIYPLSTVNLTHPSFNFN